jgi:hypothetical protein
MVLIRFSFPACIVAAAALRLPATFRSIMAKIQRSFKRAYAYGLAAGGEAGVTRAAELLKAEIVAALTLLGIDSISELRALGPAAFRFSGSLSAAKQENAP